MIKPFNKNSCCSRLRVGLLAIFFLFLPAGESGPNPSAGLGRVCLGQSPTRHTTNLKPIPQTSNSDHSPKLNRENHSITLQKLGEITRSIHPLIFTAALVLVVLLICGSMTENRELEIYLKIDFRPPEVDILK